MKGEVVDEITATENAWSEVEHEVTHVEHLSMAINNAHRKPSE